MASANADGGPLGATPSLDAGEVRKFSAMAEEWWDPRGKFAPLHALNPTRLAFIRDRVVDHFGRDPLDDRPLHGLSLLDVGCGGGLLAEPLARLGARVTGIDASGENLEIARAHAAEMELAVDYRQATAEELAAEGQGFHVVLAMEIVEHVADLDVFLEACARMVRPGGTLVLATLNRTLKSFLMAVVGAEYVLRWLPRGTHDWRRFVRPDEATGLLRAAGLRVAEVTGVMYNPLTDAWRLAPRDRDVNYMIFAAKE